MDEEQKKWLNQYYSNIGGKEFLKLGCAIAIWIPIGVVISIVFNNGTVATIFIFSMLVLPFLIRWRPVYLIFRTILGNKNLPPDPIPRSTVKIHRQPLPWYG